MPSLSAAEILSVTQAAERGVSAIVRAADEGREIVVERHGRAVAAIVGMQRLEALSELEADVRSAALVLSRLATDDGSRTTLDEVIASLGFDREELEAELDADLAAGVS